MKHPMQFIHTEKDVKRFVQNKIIRYMLDKIGGLNQIMIKFEGDEFDDDYDQLLQLIGYSTSGIPYRDKEKYNITDNEGKPEEIYQEMYKQLKKDLGPIISDLYNVHIEDLD